MRLIDLLNIANRGYPDQWLSLLYHNQTGENLDDADKQGDTLALFVVRELNETFEPSNASDIQLLEAIRVLEKARYEMQEVTEALMMALREL
jgi:hypothetical protein